MKLISEIMSSVTIFEYFKKYLALKMFSQTNEAMIESKYVSNICILIKAVKNLNSL